LNEIAEAMNAAVKGFGKAAPALGRILRAVNLNPYNCRPKRTVSSAKR
jgi:hypothetical protein